MKERDIQIGEGPGERVLTVRDRPLEQNPLRVSRTPCRGDCITGAARRQPSGYVGDGCGGGLGFYVGDGCGGGLGFLITTAGREYDRCAHQQQGRKEN